MDRLKNAIDRLDQAVGRLDLAVNARLEIPSLDLALLDQAAQERMDLERALAEAVEDRERIQETAETVAARLDHAIGRLRTLLEE